MNHVPKLKAHMRQGLELFHQGTLALCDVEHHGICIDVPYCEKQQHILSQKIEHLEEELLDVDWIRTWKKFKPRTFNMDSDDQLKEAVRGEGIEIEDVKAATLDKVKLEGMDDMVRRRKLLKLRDTFLANILEEQVDGILHPSFSLNIPRTYRSSCFNPNIQNQPARDPESAKIIRRAYIPRGDDYHFAEFDFKGAEIGTATCYHHDPTMIAYLEDDTKDLHRDMAMEIFKLEQELVSKPVRHKSKNQFVFPEFYGDWYESCAHNLFECGDVQLTDGTYLEDHLDDVGLGNMNVFNQHLRDVERDFWYRRFSVYTDWKKEWYEGYLERGWFKLKTGFACYGVLRRNEVINWPVQGTAFHFLLWCLIQVNKELKRHGMKSMVIGQIHDSIVMDIYGPELDDVKAIVKYAVTKGLKKQYTWINVPLAVEAEAAPAGQPWYFKKEIAI